MFGIEKLTERLNILASELDIIRKEHQMPMTWSYVYSGFRSTKHEDIEERLKKMEQFISDMGYEYKPESITPAKWVKKSNTAKK